MFHSSLGFHTLLLSLPISSNEQWKIIQAFKEYSNLTGKIKIFFLDCNGKHFNHDANKNSPIPRNIKITYFKDDIGLQWNIVSHDGEMGSGYAVEVKVNPKILSGISDYLTAATYRDMENLIINFNLEAMKISPLLKSFNDYKLI